MISFVSLFVFLAFGSLHALESNPPYTDSERELQSWGYTKVRQDANTFWWLFKQSKDSFQNYPLIIWLTGGPGGSSTGFANFLEVGSRDAYLKKRNDSFDRHANMLYVDNPVGAGYSYVTSNYAFARNNTQIAKDLLVMTKSFFEKHPEFKEVPLYIFSESYGGKMGATFAVHLYQAIQRKEIHCNFKGLHVGDAAISLIDSLSSWPNYLHSLALIDETQKQQLMPMVHDAQQALKEGRGRDSFDLWKGLQYAIWKMTGNLNFWNVVDDTDLPPLVTLMNETLRGYLNIPDFVSWGSQKDAVVNYLKSDFMYDVLKDIEFLLNETDIKVAVVSGQFDVVCSHLGTEAWLRKLNWKGVEEFKTKPRLPFLSPTPGAQCKGPDSQEKCPAPLGYFKQVDRLTMYWLRKVGHNIPVDDLQLSIRLMKFITKD